MNYEPVIGLEVHVQLNTKTKVFCACPVSFGMAPNTAVCPVCLGYPGTLPVLNAGAVEKAVLAGLALKSSVNFLSRFDRKSYFYPDLPKGYQITQNDLPIVSGGLVKVHHADGVIKEVRVHHMHLEEDAGKLVHNENETFSRVDLNRAGTPLLEIVSEPDMRSADEAYAYLREIRSLMKQIDVSDVNLEEGSLRCDANVSVRPLGQREFGTKVEIKNLNSFNGVRKAIEYEIERQISLIENGGKVEQETRLFDANKNITQGMRTKATVADYRYFPDPDLPDLILSEAQVKEIAKKLPESPFERRERYMKQYGLPLQDCLTLAEDIPLAQYFEACAKEIDAKKAANWIFTESMSLINEQKLSLAQFAEKLPASATIELLALVADGTISGKIAKDVYPEMLATGKKASDIVEAKGLKQVSDTGALEALIDKILADNPDQVAAYKGGKDKLFGFFVGELMKATKGQANPALASQLIKNKLG